MNNKEIETWLIPADFHWKFVDKATLEKLHIVAKLIKARCPMLSWR